MKKSLLSTLLLSAVLLGGQAQNISNSFFDHVPYIGAFDGTSDWTSGWTNFDPVNTVYPEATIIKGNGQFSRAAGLKITANETWSGVIKLDGWVYVNSGATLTIEPGTIIRGTEKSALIIERGGKINAVGTVSSPIVFTSNQGAGFRSQSNWAGLVLCGLGINNNAGGEGIAEGGIDSPYGGTDNNDNSGELRYVRIEFPGYEVATGKEINGLTLYSVGTSTKINYIQVSYSGDDGFEWFGGAVNCKYLVSYKTEDDDFDTDNGYCGMVQYGLISRDPDIVDTDAANAFESDNDASGSTAQPNTKAIFSNITAVGPSKSATEPATLLANHAGGSALRLRRNTRLQIYNSVFMGWGLGLRLESDGSQIAATSDTLTVKYSIMAGIRGDQFKEDGATFDAASLQAWYLDGSRRNQLFSTNDEVKITAPFNYSGLNFSPLAGSPVLNASYWASSSSKIFRTDETVALINYPNPFRGMTQIEISLNKQANVSLVVADLTGHTVASLQNGVLPSGRYNFGFDASNLPKGIYLARLTAGGTQKVIKLISK